MKRALALLAIAFAPSCGSSEEASEVIFPANDTPASGSEQPSSTTPSPAPSSSSSNETPAPPTTPKPLAFTAVTFNTGTSGGSEHDAPPDDGYSSNDAKTSSDYYGDGLAWSAAVDDAKAFFATLQPDIVAFQEIFYSGDCANVPADKRAGFVCSTWKAGDPTVASVVLGAGYQVACNFGKPDKCVGVKASFGNIRGCTSSFCLDGLAGTKVDGCGGGARVARGVIDLVGGGELTVVNVHGSSGMKGEDMSCRKKQVDQVFDLATGKRNLVLGDFNTDPGRLDNIDESAEHWKDFVGGAGGGGTKAFQFVSDVGSKSTPTYANSFVIDYVVSDALKGSCWTAGVTAGHPAVTQLRYFDHKPLVCTLAEK